MAPAGRKSANYFFGGEPVMARRISQERTWREDGLTLIELVLVILGIRSAVVVFAVRGVGDKGAQSCPCRSLC